MQYRVPKLGFVVVKVQTPIGRFVLIILPALLLGLSLLRGSGAASRAAKAA